MTTFVHCRGCGHQIHETAPTCPKCGAPQLAVTAASPAAAAPAIAGIAAVPTAYSQVRWFRRRWFLVLCILTIAPIAGLIAMTGDIYFDSKGVVKPFHKNLKWMLLGLSAYYVYTFTTPAGSHQQMICLVMSLAMALLMWLKPAHQPVMVGTMFRRK